MSEYMPVPVVEAQRIAVLYQKSMVVILAYDPEHQKTHTTTYGVSAFEKEQAAAVGKACVEQVIGGDLAKKVDFEDFHNDYSHALFKESLELLKVACRRQGWTPPMLQRAERLLKSAGWAIRQG